MRNSAKDPKGLPPIIRENSDYNFEVDINNDLNAPKALADAWVNSDKLLEYDKVLGLKLDEQQTFETPDEVQSLITERQQARDNKDFTKSDQLRDEIAKLGFEVKDTGEGQQITPL